MVSLIPYIGGKNRMAKTILGYLKAGGVSTLVDVFGGSGAVTLAAHGAFNKRVYNDASGDLVNLFRVLAENGKRQALFKQLKWMPPSRQLWLEYAEEWARGGYSFANVPDPVYRAALTVYRHHYTFGGKVKNGGLSVSTGDCHGIKEIVRWRNTLRRLSSIASFWGSTFIEHLDGLDVIKMYGHRDGIALYCDPPFFGTEEYYTIDFPVWKHAFLATALTDCTAHAVVSYYDKPEIRALYPSDRWEWHSVTATKNSQFRGGNKPASEVLIVKRANTGSPVTQPVVGR